MLSGWLLAGRRHAMPTDEQRKQFEAWANKQVLWQHFDVGIDWTGVQYDEMELDLAWDAFRAGQQARDAEVQALREALTYALHVLECLKVDNPNPLLPNARWKSIDMARAALAGGET